MWHQHIEKAIRSFGYESMIEWPSVYSKGWGQTLILIVLYVDDLLIAAAKALAHRASMSCASTSRSASTSTSRSTLGATATQIPRTAPSDADSTCART